MSTADAASDLKFPIAGYLISADRIFPNSCLLVSIRGLKFFFWKNEAKLGPSLLSFFKKQSQTEPKSNPNKASILAF